MSVKFSTFNRISIPSLLALVLISSIFSRTVSAEPREEGSNQHHGQGYVFFAPGAIVGGDAGIGTVHFGGGAEVLLYKGLGVGGEIGYFAPWSHPGNGIGIASLDGAYHFRRNRKLSPFATGGYSLGFRDGFGHMVNFGGGLSYWMRDRIGIRVEVRDHFQPECLDYRYFSLRLGLQFR